ncbi:hypothetical protein BJY52DRAFT_1260379, partial [Lactarius psammicola]
RVQHLAVGAASKCLVSIHPCSQALVVWLVWPTRAWSWGTRAHLPLTTTIRRWCKRVPGGHVRERAIGPLDLKVKES